MLVILTLVSTCSNLDMAIIFMLLEPIKHEFVLSDASLGILAGLAFAVAHAIGAVPLGWLADRVNRRTLIGTCLIAWSAMTALCGVAGNYVQLLLARAGVGAAESGGRVASMALVSDLYPARRRATAIAFYGLGSSLGAILAAGLAGPVAAAHGWRTAMFIAAIPGLFMALVLFGFGFDPASERRAAAAGKSKSPAGPPFGQVVRFIAGQRSLLHIYVGLVVISFALTGLNAFSPSYFIRYHAMSQVEVASIMGAAGAGSVLVTLGAGIVSDRISRNDPRWRMWMIVPVQLLNTVLFLLTYQLDSGLAVATFVLAFLLGQLWSGPGFATVQSLTPSHMRGVNAAFVLGSTFLFGFGFGPVVVGALSDAVKAATGSDGLRTVLTAVSLLNAWAAVHLLLATRTLKADLERAAQAEAV